MPAPCTTDQEVTYQPHKNKAEGENFKSRKLRDVPDRTHGCCLRSIHDASCCLHLKSGQKRAFRPDAVPDPPQARNARSPSAYLQCNCNYYSERNYLFRLLLIQHLTDTADYI